MKAYGLKALHSERAQQEFQKNPTNLKEIIMGVRRGSSLQNVSLAALVRD